MQKQEFRQRQKLRLKQQEFVAFKRDFAVFKECLFWIKKFKAKRILLYHALAYEPNLLRFRRKLSKNYELFVPFMQDKSLKIVKYRLPLFKKRFGVLEPRNSFLNAKIDLAIVPVIGVDRNFKRIGHGQGFYDRFFGNLKQKPLIIFVQSINALSWENLTQEHDVVGEFYLNPYKKYYKKDIKNDSCNRCTYRRYHRRGNRIFSC